MRAAGTYSHSSHTLKVMKGSKARCGGRSVLSVMCMRSEFNRPEVTISKSELIKLTGLERKAVQKALVFLRAEKSIVPIAHFEGGSGKAVTYRLDVIGQGAEQTKEPQRGRRERIAEIMASDPRLTYGEAVLMAAE